MWQSLIEPRRVARLGSLSLVHIAQNRFSQLNSLGFLSSPKPALREGQLIKVT